MKGKIIIHQERCKGCGYCVDTCPSGVIAVGKRFNRAGFFPAITAHPEKCTGCAMCASLCPEIAIEVFREDRGKKKKQASR